MRDFSPRKSIELVFSHKKETVVVTARRTQSIEAFLTLELGQHGESRSTCHKASWLLPLTIAAVLALARQTG